MPETAHLVVPVFCFFLFLSVAIITGFAFLDLLKKLQPRPRYIRVRRRTWDGQ